jgi:energy-coupling factor transporter transmembrane protein EcfT
LRADEYLQMKADVQNWGAIRSYADRYLALVCLIATVAMLGGLEGDATLALKSGGVVLLCLLVAFDKVFVFGAALVFVTLQGFIAFLVWQRTILLMISLVSGILLLGIIMWSGKFYRGRQANQVWWWYDPRREQRSKQILLDIVVISLMALAFLALRDL